MILLLVQYTVTTKELSRSSVVRRSSKLGISPPVNKSLYISFMVWAAGQVINLLNNEDVLDNLSEMYIAMTRC